MLSPYTLVRIISKNEWDRAFFEPGASGFSIYFLNKDNRVLQQLTVSADMLARMEHGETPRIDRLENLPQFANRIAHEGVAVIRIVTDATDPNTAKTIESYATAIIPFPRRPPPRRPLAGKFIEVARAGFPRGHFR